jgi:hypothetical protein
MMKKFEINKLSNIRRIIARRVFIYQETICFGGIQTKVTSLSKLSNSFLSSSLPASRERSSRLNLSFSPVALLTSSVPIL